MSGDAYRRGGERYSREEYSSHHDRGDYRDRDRHRDRDRDRRRRSRSPHDRGMRRGNDVDSYSTSRDYREREREDRYRGRRDERAWDRDRFREDRRRDEERPPRRERDLFDDRKRRDEDRTGGRGRDRERKKSASPPRKKREPTPDLTNVTPILERRRRLTLWDIKPSGYENITAEQAKLSGMFPLPGAPRQQPMDPKQLQAFMGSSAPTVSSTALNPTTAKQSKRLFVTNLPTHALASDENIVDFFNLQLNGINIISSNDPCVSAKISADGTLAMIEFRNPEDATVALALDGISMEADTEMTNGSANGTNSGLRIIRPKDYIVPTDVDNSDSQPGVVSNVVKDSPNKLCITHIPLHIDDEQFQDLLESFGGLKAFVCARDVGNGQSKGFAFCEYQEDEGTNLALEQLSGLELAGQILQVNRASTGVRQASAIGGAMGVNAMSLLAGTADEDVEHGRTIQLLNMLTADELLDNTEYEEILEDVREEVQKFGHLEGIKIPRPTTTGGRSAPGVGRIFLKYDTNETAKMAMSALAGRKFADRTVVVTWFSEEYFDLEAW